MRKKHGFQPKSLRSLSDDALLRRLSELVQKSRRVESELIAHIAEVDERKLYLGQACSSMFVYATEVLHLSEAEAYLRITVARASRQHPILLDMLADGSLHLRGIVMVAALLTPANRDEVLQRAVGKSKRQLEELVAELSPKPDVPATVRKLPSRRGKARETASPELDPGRVDTAPAPGPAAPAVVEPLSPARYQFKFTGGAELRDKLERLQALMRPSIPDGDLGPLSRMP